MIFRDVNEAVERICMRLSEYVPGKYPPVNLEQFTQPLAAINAGLETFYDSLLAQGASAVQLDWRPPAGGDEKLGSLLARMKGAA